MSEFDLDSKAELKKVGDRLRELRKAKGFSSYENFAFTHNLSRAQYGRYEKGQDLRLSSLLKVLKALETPLILCEGQRGLP